MKYTEKSVKSDSWCDSKDSFFFQAEDGIRGLVRSRGLRDVYKRQVVERNLSVHNKAPVFSFHDFIIGYILLGNIPHNRCLLYTSDAADERSSVDLGGCRSIKKKKNNKTTHMDNSFNNLIHMINTPIDEFHQATNTHYHQS